MTATQREVLRNTLDNLTGTEFKRFKHDLQDQGQIASGKLEKADTDDTVDWMVQVYSTGAGDVMLTILKKMNHNQLAKDLERHLEELGGQQCSPDLAGVGGGVKVNATAHSGGMVNAPAVTGCTIRGPVTFNFGRSPMPQQEEVGGEQCFPCLVRKDGGVKADITAHSGGMVDAPALSRGSLMPQQGEDGNAAEEVKKRKASLKLKLQKHLKKRFSVVHQESGDYKVQDIYTELHIVEGSTGGVSNEHEVSTIDMRQIGTRPSSDDKQVKLANMFTDSATNVLTLGIAGVGKTIAVQKFVMDWVEEKANQDIDFVFVLPFRELNLRKGEHYNFLDLLHLFYPYRKDLENIPDLSECKILFVLDGLDESRLQLDFGKWICELEAESTVDLLITSLIKGTLVPSALLWVTTRPAAASQIPEDCFNLVTEVRGFNDLQKDEFFQNNIENPEKAKRLIDHINKNRSLHIMCHIPVFCRILANVVEKILECQSKKESAKTLTELYTLYSVSQIKRMDDKYSEDKKMSAEEKGQFLVKLGKLAFKHLDKGTLIFYEKDLAECHIDVNWGALQAGVCTQIFNMASGSTGENVFSFVHLSVQEFLAALFVLHKGVHWANPFLKTWKEKISWWFTHTRFDLYRFALEKALQSQNGHLDLFVRFLLGLAPMLEPEMRSPLDVVLPQLAIREVSIKKTVQYIKKKIRKDISPERIINLFHCLNELGDNSLVEEINRYINSADEKKNLTPAQCSALAYLLLMSAKDLDEFDLKKYLKSEEGLRRLLPVVKVSRRVWLNQCHLSKASCEMMASVLQGTPSHLRELDMGGNYLQDEGMELLCVGLRDPQCKMETLRLNRCDLSKASCEMMASLLQGTPSHLRELDMSNNYLQDEGMELLCVGLRDPQCKMETLRLNRCDLSEASCEMIASTLLGTPSYLRELAISGNKLQDEGVELLCVGLRDPQCKMETLRLNHCRLSKTSCEMMASVLQGTSSHLRELDMSDNDLKDDGMNLLCVGLRDPQCKLETLRSVMRHIRKAQ
ncbi:NACHT, LRR and PYD domains-containing protein 12-like isoform X2 [Clupea harengus]|uniref:NACHT, LRR and PYD domains-containing protein 12-like isoform X2 n=1 Tax=Clupea harengus TaxID=7950 RepID=A0A6P8F3C3_CLUHA|nr:NACHT, LRR and PYD domains-containing protein 12-like isoform X2 [Clupea harengus]